MSVFRVSIAQSLLFCLIVLLLCLPKNCRAITLTLEEKAYLQEKGALLFVSQTRYPPFEFLDEHQQQEGMMIDMVRWLAVEIGFQPVFQHLAFKDAQEAVLTGKADVLTSLFLSEKRQQQWAFTKPLFDVPASIFVKSNRTDIQGINSLEGKKIAIQMGDYAREYLGSHHIDFTLSSVRDFGEAAEQVLLNQADAVIGDEQIVLHYIYSNNLIGELKKMGEPLYIGRNCMATRKDNALLIGILNKGITEAKQRGVLDKISKKWLGTSYTSSSGLPHDQLGLVIAIIAALIGLSLAIWLWNVRLRILVRKKTQDIIHNEQALRDNEEKFRSIFDHSLDAILFTEPRANILAANPAACRLLGYTEKELCALHRNKLMDEEAPDLIVAEEERKAKGLRCKEIELTKKDGTRFPAEISSAIFTLENKASRSCIIIRDISARKQTQQELEEQKKQLQMALMGTDLAIWDWQVHSGQLIMNRRWWHSLLGREIPTNGGPISFWRKLVHPDDMPHLRQRAKAHINGVTPFFEAEYRMRHADGHYIWVLNKGKAMERDARGRALHMAGTCLDVTRRKEAEQQLKLSEERLSLAMKASQGTLWDCDLLKGKMYYSPGCWHMLGYEPDERSGGPELWKELCHPQDLSIIKGLIRTHQYQGDTFDITARLHHKEGHYVHVLVRGCIVRDDHQCPVRISGTNTDLTERRKLEQERREWERQGQQLKKMESLNRMAGAIAHHFNNLLGAVLGNLEIAQESLPLGTSTGKVLAAAQEAGEKAAHVSGLLLTSLGQSICEFSTIDLAALCRQTLKKFEARLAPAIELRQDISAQPVMVKGCQEQLEQLIENLVLNAIEAIGDVSGSLVVQLSLQPRNHIAQQNRFPLDWQSFPAHYACLEIRDTGSGIAAEEMEQLFDPFYSKKFTGRGLGLSVVLGILRTHNGCVTVASNQHQGSSFRVYLPLPEENE